MRGAQTGAGMYMQPSIVWPSFVRCDSYSHNQHYGKRTRPVAFSFTLCPELPMQPAGGGLPSPVGSRHGAGHGGPYFHTSLTQTPDVHGLSSLGHRGAFAADQSRRTRRASGDPPPRCPGGAAQSAASVLPARSSLTPSTSSRCAIRDRFTPPFTQLPTCTDERVAPGVGVKITERLYKELDAGPL